MIFGALGPIFDVSAMFLNSDIFINNVLTGRGVASSIEM